MFVKLFGFLALFGVVLTGPTNMCPGKPLYDLVRTNIVNQHNNFRISLARGDFAINKLLSNGYAPSAKNMYELFYDCELEASAQALADKCENKSSSETGEIIYMGKGKDINSDFIQAIAGWIKYNGEITPTNLSFTQAIVESKNDKWAQAAWAKTTKVGCGYSSCGASSFMIVCHYNAPGNVIGENIYEIGTPCTSDAECTTYPDSKCDCRLYLCYNNKEAIKPFSTNTCRGTIAPVTPKSPTITTTISPTISTTFPSTTTSSTSHVSTSPIITTRTSTSPDSSVSSILPSLTTNTVAEATTSIGCDKSGYQLLSSAADPSISNKGKFGGYFQNRSSCEELCNQNYGLFKCIGYMYQPRNQGKCTIFQYSFDDENPNSIASLFKKC